MNLVGRLRARWKRWRDPLRCQDAVELVTDYMEGALPGAQRRIFERHLGNCAECAAYLAQVRLTADVLGHVHPPPPPEPARVALIEALRQIEGE